MILKATQDLASTRLQSWNEALEQWQHVTDGRGYPIDKGILETVVVLNLLSIQTTSSCAGHTARPHTHPWVNIGVRGKEHEEQEQRWDELNGLFMANCELTPGGFPAKVSEEAIGYFHERNALGESLRKANHALLRKLVNYLDAFYRIHQSSYDRHLILSDAGLFGEKSLCSLGADLMDTLPQRQRRAKLAEYQEEMQLFTAFLKRQELCLPEVYLK